MSTDERFEGYDDAAARADEASTDGVQPYVFDPSTIQHRTPEHATRADIEVMSVEFHADPFERMAWMRENAPVYWDDVTGLWAITSHAGITAVERDWRTYCSVKGSRPESSVPSMINLDPPEHTRRRRLVAAGFTPRRVAVYEDFLRATIIELVDAVIDGGECDFVEQIAKPIPLRMIAQLMGLPLADEEQLLHWSDLFATGGDDIRAEVEQAVMEWVGYIIGHMKERTDPEAEDLISLLMYAEGDPLSAEDLIYETMLILVGGDETTRHVMSGGLQALLLHPEQWQALRDDRSLLEPAIEEMLRWVTPVRNMNRTAVEDVELGGQQILAGDRLLLLYLSGNRDADAFDRPDEFDIHREPQPHLAFGAHGRHYCMGAQLARIELRILFEEVLDRLPEIQLAEPGVEQPERTGNFVLGIEHLPVVWPT